MTTPVFCSTVLSLFAEDQPITVDLYIRAAVCTSVQTRCFFTLEQRFVQVFKHVVSVSSCVGGQEKTVSIGMMLGVRFELEFFRKFRPA